MIETGTVGEEDCLWLSVFTPRIQSLQVPEGVLPDVAQPKVNFVKYLKIFETLVLPSEIFDVFKIHHTTVLLIFVLKLFEIFKKLY